MTMHGDLSPEARDRAGHTVTVATVFEDNAERIVATLPELADEHVLVVVVDATHELAGMHHVAQSDLVMRVPELETAGGWAMVFSQGSTVEDVRRRAQEMASIAAKRAAAIDRIIARRDDGG
jgi:riboflavin biosynthesis pyrimidine reductase